MPKPKIIFYHDGRHPLIYMYEPPMRKEEYEAAVDELVGTPIEAIAFCLGDGRTVLHDTTVGELWGSPIDKWSHIIFRRAHQNAKHLIEEGNDPLRIISERAHAKGLLIYPTLLVNQGSGECGEDMRGSKFRFNNKQWDIGAKGGVDPSSLAFDCADFMFEEIRDERLALIEETLSRYDVDGFELQMNYIPYYFHPSEIDPGREVMNRWIRRVYEVVKKGGSDQELMIRIRGDMDWCFTAGLDVKTWIRDGIVDVIIPESTAQQVDTNADLRPFVEAAKGTDCRILASLTSHMDSDRLNEGTIETIRAEACNYWQQGIDGLYVNQWFSRWPYQGSFYEILREVPHPDIMAPKDKIYHVPTETGRHPTERLQPDLVPRLPVDLLEGKCASAELMVSDDLPRWDRVGRVHEVILRIRVIEATELDQLCFRFNGKEVPSSLMRTINQMYTMDSPRYLVWGYWFVFRLDREHWPVNGRNVIEVTLLKRDPDVTSQIYLRDVELEIKYLMGKKYHRDFVDTDIGPYERVVE